jgi:hypothetical protein
MALSAKAKKQLNEMAKTLPQPTHHSPQDFRKPISVFIRFYQAGDMKSLHPDVIRDWAHEHGWSESDARDLGEMAETVCQTMMELENPTR